MIGADRAHQVVVGTIVDLIGTYAETNPLKKMSKPVRGNPTLFNLLDAFRVFINRKLINTLQSNT